MPGGDTAGSGQDPTAVVGEAQPYLTLAHILTEEPLLSPLELPQATFFPRTLVTHGSQAAVTARTPFLLYTLRVLAPSSE